MAKNISWSSSDLFPSPPRINASYISNPKSTTWGKVYSKKERKEAALSVNAYRSMLLQEDLDLDRTIKSLDKYFKSIK